MSFINPQHRKLLIVIAAASFGLGLAGCDGDRSTSTNGPGFEQVRGPVGNIAGSVVDQNGAPLAGVTVSVGGKSIVTDVNGQIQIEGVTVTSTTGDNSGGNFNPLSVTLRAPAGYAGATATVNASAQLSCSPLATSNPECVFVDGFTASMGTIVLPALNSRVIGTLRDVSTGLPVSAAIVELDFRGLLPDQQVGGNGVTIAIDHPGIAAATTANDGTFSFTGVAADACFEISRTGHSLSSQGSGGTDIGCRGGDGGGFAIVSNGQLVNTNREGSNTASTGTLLSTPARNIDNVAPYVNSVGGANRASGVLAAGIDGTAGIVVTFSEAIATPLSAGDLQIVAITPDGNRIVPFTLSASTANSFTATLASALPQGTSFEIRIRASEAVDAAGNAITTDNGVTASDPNYVELGFDAVNGGNLVLALQTFAPFVGAPDAPVLSQVTTQQNNSTVAPFLSSSSFIDSLAEQTNPVDNLSNGIGSVFEGELEQLNTAAVVAPGQIAPLLDLGAVVAGVTSLDQSAARFTIDLSSATTAPAFVSLSLLRNGVVQPAATFYTVDTTAQSRNNGSSFIDLQNGSFDSVFDVIVTGAQPGDEVRAISRNTSFDLGSESRLSLVDIAPPTTALSPLAAGLTAINANLAALNVSAGGAIGGGAAQRHLVVFPVTPQSLDTSDSSIGFSNDNLQSEIGSANATFAAEGGTTGVTADATSTAAFVPANVRLGVSFTEALGPIMGTPATPGMAAFSNFQVQNDLATENGNRFSFVTFDISNVYTLENSGRGANGASVIDFTGTVEDTTGRIADSAANARVLVRDALPPLMTRAYRNAAGLTFEFHEAIRLVGEITLDDCGSSINLGVNQAGIANAADRITLSADNRTVTVPLANPQFPLNAAACFPDNANTNYAEAAYDALSAPTAGTALRHGRVRYETVRDRAAGTVLGQSFPDNTWADWSNANLGMTPPVFAAADLIGPFVVTGIVCGPVFSNGAVPGSQFACDVGFSQPISMASGMAAVTNPAAFFQLETAAGALRGATVNSVGGRIGTSVGSGEGCSFMMQTCNVVRVSLTVAGTNVVTGDRLNMPGNVNVFTSALDNTLRVGRDAGVSPVVQTPFRASPTIGGVAP